MPPLLPNFNRRDSRRPDMRYLLWGGALLLLALTPLAAGFVGFGWEAAQWAGLAAALACIALSGAPIRPRNSEPPTLLSLDSHTLLGWIALCAVAVHVGGLLLADHKVIEYLKFSAPPYQYAGIAAALLLSVLAVISMARARRRLWKSHRGFQATHIALGCLLAALIAIHVVVTARYLGGPARRALYIAAAVGALLMLLRARRPSQAARGAAGARAQLVFGRHSSFIVVTVIVCATATATLLPARVEPALREPFFKRTSAMPLNFPHSKHGTVNCLVCHHNYADATGSDQCVQCHRSDRTDLKLGIEARFHGFCFECHRHPDAAFKDHGPVSGCSSCHQPPTSE